jgi:hypothetical protein
MTANESLLIIGLDTAMLSVLRLLLIVAAVVNVLAATVLYRRIFGPLYRRWWSAVRRRGAEVPHVLEDERVQRGWGLLSAIMFLVMWWLLRPGGGIPIR